MNQKHELLLSYSCDHVCDFASFSEIYFASSYICLQRRSGLKTGPDAESMIYDPGFAGGYQSLPHQ